MTQSSFADTAQEALDDAKAQAQHTARETAEGVQDRVVEEADQTADAAQRASDAFDPGSLQAAALAQLAQGIEGMAQTLRDRSIDGLVDDVAVFARRNPVLFLSGAALAGFAAARFLKSSPTHADDDVHDPWTDHLSNTGGSAR
ncbi:hypothetical protein ACG74X_10920 [Marivita sp. S0852]|uniref:hypothetical protein n=1 Tax=Marivita sp. S0852 TaxID=3373893 RepID=UPI003981CF88